MRILLVGDPQQPHVQRWAGALQSAGNEVLCAGFGHFPSDAAPTELVALGSDELNRRRYLLALPALRRVMRSFRPDIVHAHFVSSYGVMASLVSAGTPTIQFAWGSDVLWHARHTVVHRAAVVRTLKAAAAVVVDAEDVAEVVRRLAPRSRIERVVFGPEASWTTAARSPRPMVLSPRQLKSFYNVESIVLAFAQIAEEHPSWTLDVLTGGGDSTQLQQRVSKLRDTSRIRFLPRLSREELQREFLNAAVVCSVPNSDATSVALLEAMATGALPIVSDLPANRAWIEDGVNGLVVAPGDISALSFALHRAVVDEELQRRAEAENRAIIRRVATWEIAVAAVEELSQSTARG